MEGLRLCCLMTPGLSMDIQCHVWLYSFQSDIKSYVKWAASLVIAGGHFCSSSGVCVGMYGLIYSLITPRVLGGMEVLHM